MIASEWHFCENQMARLTMVTIVYFLKDGLKASERVASERVAVSDEFICKPPNRIIKPIPFTTESRQYKYMRKAPDIREEYWYEEI